MSSHKMKKRRVNTNPNNDFPFRINADRNLLEAFDLLANHYHLTRAAFFEAFCQKYLAQEVRGDKSNYLREEVMTRLKKVGAKNETSD